MKIELIVHPISEGLPNKDDMYLVWYKGSEYPVELMFAASSNDVLGEVFKPEGVSDHPCFYDTITDEYGIFMGNIEIVNNVLAYWSERPKIPREAKV